MSDYTKIVDFAAKDALSTGNAAKLAKGTELGAELDAIVTAVATKYDSNDLSDQSTAETGTSNTVLMTPLRSEQHVANYVAENGGMLLDIHALADPGADTVLGWDDSANDTIGYTLHASILHSATELSVDHDAATNFVADEHVAHAGVTMTAGTGMTGGGTIASTRTLNVIGGVAITANANDIDVDFSGLTNRTIADTAATDSIMLNNGGVMEQIDIQKMGIRVVELSTTQTFALGDANTLQVLTGATGRDWTIPPNSSVAFHIGTTIMMSSRDAGAVGVDPGAGVTLTSVLENAGSTTRTIPTGGTAAIIKVATDEWMLVGDIT